MPGRAFVSAREGIWCETYFPTQSVSLSFFLFASCFCFCFVFSNSPGSLGHFFEAGDVAIWLLWHTCAGAHTLLHLFIQPFKKMCSNWVAYKTSVKKISHVIAGGECDGVKRRPRFHEIKEDHHTRVFGWRERWLNMGCFFMGEKSKLMCQTTFSHQQDMCYRHSALARHRHWKMQRIACWEKNKQACH